MGSDGIVTRRLGAVDLDVVQWVLYTALSWSDDPDMPPLEVAVQHPDVARYHERWGRAGDIGVKAVAGGDLVGAAVARLFTDEDNGYGYVDAATPEVGIGVVQAYRRRGIGRRLMLELAEAARAQGVVRLSLSVNNPNPARLLYVSLGYTTVEDDGNSSVMVLDL